MKKLIATILTATVLLTSSVMILAENGKMSKTTAGTQEKFNNILVVRAEDRAKLQEAFQDRKTELEAKWAKVLEKKALYTTNRAEFEAFKVALMAKREELLTLKSESLAIRVDNVKLRGDLRNSLGKIKDEGIALPAQTKLELDAAMAEIKVLTDKIKETNGQIKDTLQENKGFIKNKDYVSMETAFDEVIAVQKFRNESLTQINTILKDMVTLLATVV